ncbi:hypothetical protein TNCV_1283901 [Trichonephila clavipes]|uniref:Uncharacterized protein n=1 Tax=Trichonephila clavipes TaxID=2585209 RepID=A0A8X6SQB8_TRICX|nr:hypothetical protein TNCV_1283901 [Trichonephila clavipes]
MRAQARNHGVAFIASSQRAEDLMFESFWVRWLLQIIWWVLDENVSSFFLTPREWLSRPPDIRMVPRFETLCVHWLLQMIWWVLDVKMFSLPFSELEKNERLELKWTQHLFLLMKILPKETDRNCMVQDPVNKTDDLTLDCCN